MSDFTTVELRQLFDELLDIPMLPGQRRLLQELHEKFEKTGRLPEADEQELVKFYERYAVPKSQFIH